MGTRPCFVIGRAVQDSSERLSSRWLCAGAEGTIDAIRASVLRQARHAKSQQMGRRCCRSARRIGDQVKAGGPCARAKGESDIGRTGHLRDEVFDDLHAAMQTMSLPLWFLPMFTTRTKRHSPSPATADVSVLRLSLPSSRATSRRLRPSVDFRAPQTELKTGRPSNSLRRLMWPILAWAQCRCRVQSGLRKELLRR
jgi:hypothetical protein